MVTDMVAVYYSKPKVTLPKHELDQNKTYSQKCQSRSVSNPNLKKLICRKVIISKLMMGYDLSFLTKYLLFIQGIESNPGPSYTIVKSVQKQPYISCCTALITIHKDKLSLTLFLLLIDETIANLSDINCVDLLLYGNTKLYS